MTRTGSAYPQPRPHLEEKLHDARASTIPCPMLSLMVMEDLITPDAEGNVEHAQLISALGRMGLGRLQRHLLSHGTARSLEGDGNRPINLFNLLGSRLDHKGSLGPLQNGGFNEELMEDLLGCSTDGESLTLADLTRAQHARMLLEGGEMRDRMIGAAELSALLLLFGTPNAHGENALRLEDATAIFRDNRLPEGFERHSLSTMDLLWNMATIAYMESNAPKKDEPMRY